MVSNLLPSALDSNRWLRVWGLPILRWNHKSFNEIGDYCGRLVMVDLQTKSITNISYARIKVEADLQNYIPRHMVITIGEEEFDLLLEVEMSLGSFGSQLAA